MRHDPRSLSGPAGRRAVLAVGIGSLIAAAGCGSRKTGRSPTFAPSGRTTPDPPPPSSGPSATPHSQTPHAPKPHSPTPHSPSSAARPQLPRGGRSIFPHYRVVAYYGTAGTAGLGVLGSESPNAIAARIERAAAKFASHGRTILPAMELIVTIADRSPGPAGTYHHSIGVDRVRSYLTAARKHKMLLILDVQPGHSTFPPVVEQWQDLLMEPDVGLGLDAEWRMPDGKVPGKAIGHTSAEEINQTTSWLSAQVRRHDLPEKPVVIHQFSGSMIRDIDKVAEREGLALVQQLDGFGSAADKIAKYDDLQRPKQFHLGFKLFYREDTGLMSPSRVLKLKPPPEYVSYQ